MKLSVSSGCIVHILYHTNVGYLLQESYGSNGQGAVITKTVIKHSTAPVFFFAPGLQCFSDQLFVEHLGETNKVLDHL